MASTLYGQIPINPPQNAQVGSPAAAPDPYATAVTEAKTRYPRFAHLPIKMTSQGPSIPYGSETYPPNEGNNPHPGNWTIQVHPSELAKGPKYLADTVGLEMIHGLQGTDPQYQKFTDQFIKSMTPGQMSLMRREYKKDQAGGEKRPFDEYMRTVQAQEYIRGGIFTDAIPNWIGPKGEGHYTPEQTKLLGQIKNYLQTPASPK
jgi:hypothetical protein